VPDDTILDSPERMLAGDPGAMLAATGDAGAQVRRGLQEANRDTIEAIAAEGRPRSIVVTGMGGSGISGQVIEAFANNGSPIPVVSSRGYGLPTWVGQDDIVIALSCSGGTEETIAAAKEAARRGSRLVSITSTNSILEGVTNNVKGAKTMIVNARGLMPRASMWTLLTPLLMIGNAVGVVKVSDDDLRVAADFIDEVANDCAVEKSIEENPAKLLALQFASSLPMIWGTGAVGPVASYRVISQLAENAKIPAIHGEIPESQHNQVVVLDGPLAGTTSIDDIFADREGKVARKFRLVLLRDSVEHPQMSKRADIVTEIAERRNVPVSRVNAHGSHIVHRLASLVAVTDWASVYAALALGIDPSPIGPINELKARLQD
jgi:glucose/mannose-6-phosphate isomerase